MSFIIQDSAIDCGKIRAGLQDRGCGAVVLFEGWVRDHNEGRKVERLEYEVYTPLAVKEGLAIIKEARERWALAHAVGVHRSGMLALGEVAVAVGVASAHRDEAFQATRYIIDQAKLRLPIWKKEFYRDGDAHWVNCRRCAGREQVA